MSKSLPISKARRVIALRLIGAPVPFLCDAANVRPRVITATLAKHGVFPRAKHSEFDVPIGTSYSINLETHATLKLPSWVPCIADGVATFSQRLVAALDEALERSA